MCTSFADTLFKGEENKEVRGEASFVLTIWPYLLSTYPEISVVVPLLFPEELEVYRDQVRSPRLFQ